MLRPYFEPKAIIGTYLSMLTKITIQLVEWEWPADIRQLICAPLSHAGGAMVLPTLIKGGAVVILPGFNALNVMQAIEKYQLSDVRAGTTGNAGGDA